MEGESSVAGWLLFTVILAAELVFYMLRSIAYGVPRRETEDDDSDSERKMIRGLSHIADLFEKQRGLTTLLFSVVTFIIGALYMMFISSTTIDLFMMVCPMMGRWSTIWLQVISLLLFLIVYVLFNLIFGIAIPNKVIAGFGSELTAEEQIISMVNEGHEQGVFQASEAEMIHNIFEFGDKEAKDIMINRSSIVAIDADMTLAEAIDFMLAEKNSRYPVFEENLDHIIGILHFKDAIRLQASNKRLRGMLKSYPELIREAVFIPETRNLDNLFHSMQSSKTQMVIVVDEYGQTSGLVAMEDLLEEIVGNIMDEYDEDEEYIEEKGENVYEIDGLTPLDELVEELGITFDDEEFETLNGFLISKIEHIPADDEQFEMDYKGYHFKLLSVENKVIKTVLVKKALNS